MPWPDADDPPRFTLSWAKPRETIGTRVLAKPQPPAKPLRPSPPVSASAIWDKLGQFIKWSPAVGWAILVSIGSFVSFILPDANSDDAFGDQRDRGDAVAASNGILIEQANLIPMQAARVVGDGLQLTAERVEWIDGSDYPNGLVIQVNNPSSCGWTVDVWMLRGTIMPEDIPAETVGAERAELAVRGTQLLDHEWRMMWRPVARATTDVPAGCEQWSGGSDGAGGIRVQALALAKGS